jgi:hypothetical protein
MTRKLINEISLAPSGIKYSRTQLMRPGRNMAIMGQRPG